MKLVANITYGANGWKNAIDVIGTRHQLIEHLFKIARECDRSPEGQAGPVEYVLEDDLDDPYNPSICIRSQDAFGERDFLVLAFVRPAIEL